MGIEGGEDAAHGLGSDDNPVFPDMHTAAAHVVGGTVEACRQVLSGESLHSANIVGGLHHAMADRSSGFCIYNDIAVGIQFLLDSGVERIAYVDIDVHHGDGVEKIFYDDPRVLTISLHETGQMLFPGTGFPQDTGGEGAEGTSVNVALPPGTADGGWLRAFHAVVPPLLREWKPQVPVTQHGCDSHMEDPLAHLMLSVDGQRAAYLALHDLAHELCDGKWVVTGGGGYAPGRGGAACPDAPARDRRRRAPLARHRDARRPACPRRGDLGSYGAAPTHRRPQPRLSRLVGRLRPRDLGWTGRSWPRGPRYFPSTGSTRTRNQRDTPYVPQVSLVTPFPTGHIGPIFAKRAPRTCDTGGGSRCRCAEGMVHKWLPTSSETCRTSSS
ncbi:acetoin utilization protein AcuC [Nocardioides sp. B-3]|uniref:acetoin utilization protein AcuC n=1 Tax=Nocardioides sp. B-3 TaxID=2895565 RepID=UPI00300DFC7A